jgi:hypothetical protein
MKKKLPKSVRKFIRREKAKTRKESISYKDKKYYYENRRNIQAGN